MAKKILIIDDAKVVVAILADALKERKYEVLTAYDGREGLKQVKEGKPDLIVLDMHMPEMNGYEFIRALRGIKLIEGHSLPPVIMLTASEDLKDVFKLEGVRDYVVKPLEASALIEKIENCLGQNE